LSKKDEVLINSPIKGSRLSDYPLFLIRYVKSYAVAQTKLFTITTLQQSNWSLHYQLKVIRF